MANLTDGIGSFFNTTADVDMPKFKAWAETVERLAALSSHDVAQISTSAAVLALDPVANQGTKFAVPGGIMQAIKTTIGGTHAWVTHALPDGSIAFNLEARQHIGLSGGNWGQIKNSNSPIGNDARIVVPSGGNYSTAGNHTGGFRIRLPVLFPTTFVTIDLLVGEGYAGGLDFEMSRVQICGYAGSGGTWLILRSNTTNRFDNSPYYVVGGSDATSSLLWIFKNAPDDFAGFWIYPQIQILNVTIGIGHTITTPWESGWVIDPVAAYLGSEVHAVAASNTAIKQAGGGGGLASVTANAPLTGLGTAGSPLDVDFAALTAADVRAIVNAIQADAGGGGALQDLQASMPGGGLTSVTANAPLTGAGTGGSPLDVDFTALVAADVRAIVNAIQADSGSGGALEDLQSSIGSSVNTHGLVRKTENTAGIMTDLSVVGSTAEILPLTPPEISGTISFSFTTQSMTNSNIFGVFEVSGNNGATWSVLTSVSAGATYLENVMIPTVGEGAITVNTSTATGLLSKTIGISGGGTIPITHTQLRFRVRITSNPAGAGVFRIIRERVFF